MRQNTNFHAELLIALVATHIGELVSSQCIEMSEQKEHTKQNTNKLSELMNKAYN